MIRRYAVYVLLVFLAAGSAQAQLDTLSSRTVAPGVIYTKYFQPGPYVLDVLEIDLTNPFIQIETTRPNQLTRTSVQSAQNDSEGHRVIGAINGDFFSFETHWPINNQIVNGTFVLGRPAIRSHFAVDDSKRPFIEQLSFQGSVSTTGGQSHAVHRVNENRGSGQIVFYTPFRGSSTGTTGGVEYAVRLASGEEWVAGDTVRVVVTGTSTSGGMAIPAGGGVISAASGAPATFLTSNAQVNDTLKLYLGFNPDLKRVTQVMAGGGKILEDGVNVSARNTTTEGISSAFMTARHPRTFVAINQDSTRVFFATVDGRQASSLGMNFNEMASFLQAIGAWHAVNLDGGGSTTMVVRGEVVNSPSDPGGERSVANTLQVISTAPQGTLSFLTIEPASAEVFQGGTRQFSATGTDEYYNPIVLPSDVTWEVDDHIGTISSTGLFTAHEVNASGWVRIRWQDVVDSARVDVRVLEALHVYPKSLIMVPGERVQLVFRGLDTEGNRVSLESSQVNLALSGSGLNIGAGGLVTATAFGTGEIVASVESVTTTVPFDTHGEVATLSIDEFADLFEWTPGVRNTAPANVTVAISDEQASAGSTSVKVGYASATGGALDLHADIPLSGRLDNFHLDVYGDGGGHTVRIRIRDRDGDAFTIAADQKVTWSGEWRRLTFPVVDAVPVAGGVLDFPVSITRLTVEFGKAAGEIFLDNLEGHYPVRAVTPTVLWNFESGITGWFTPQQTHNAQIHGVNVSQSSLVWSSERAYKGTRSGKWTFVDDTASSADWNVRITRGANQDLGNILRGSYVGAWVYVEGQTNLQLRIVIRGGDGQLKQGPPLALNHTGWKLIGAKLDNDQFVGYIHAFTPFTASGNQFNGFVLTGKNADLHGQTRVFFIDELVTSALTVPTGFHALSGFPSGPNVQLEWTVNSEWSVNRYEIERAFDGDFTTVGSVNAVGNTDAPQQYSFADTPSGYAVYHYRIRQITNDGGQELSPAIEVNFGTIDTESGSGLRFGLEQNFPNPFGSSTSIQYSLAQPSHVTVRVWNVLGQEVMLLADGPRDAGAHLLTVDASHLSSGMYFYRMDARVPGSDASLFSDTKRFMVVR
jgi:hypothetical protein